jgi:hypothetical protein
MLTLENKMELGLIENDVVVSMSFLSLLCVLYPFTCPFGVY